MRDLVLRNGIRIKASELVFTFSRSSGPGGQNVNKLSTKVLLRFDAAKSASLTGAQKEMVLGRAGGRARETGEIAVVSEKTRSRQANIEDAVRKLRKILEVALTPARKRTATKPTKASKARRIEFKKKRGIRKGFRARPGDAGE